MIDKDTLLEFHEKMMKRIEGERIFKREVEINPVKDKALSLVGPRRAGKTYAMLYYLKRNMNRAVYINLEHPCFKNPTHRDVIEAINAVAEYEGVEPSVLLLDEVQNVSEWEKVVRGLIDVGYYVVISGSSSKLLSKEIATQLRGRSVERIVLPLSFREYLSFKGVESKKLLSISQKVKILKLVEDYLTQGSYPEIVLNQERADETLRNYFVTILYRDFVERFRIENLEVARFLLEFCLENFSKEISGRKVANYVSSLVGRNVKNLVYDYLGKLPETLVIFLVERINRSVYARKSWPKKLYVCDLGLANVVSFSENLGKRMENTVFLELLRKTNENPLTEIYYFKKPQEYEVDFVVKEGLKVKQLIQVTYANSFDEIDRREWRALLKAYELFKAHKPELIIITWDYEDEKEISWFNKRAKIKFIPLWKWLLF